jgi:hypothetical protein
MLHLQVKPYWLLFSALILLVNCSKRLSIQYASVEVAEEKIAYTERIIPAVTVYVSSLTQKDIQTAVDSVREMGGIVILPEGRAQITGLIRMFGGVSIVGQGPDKTILYRGDFTPDNPQRGIIEVNGLNGGNVRIQGISFEGFTTPDNDFRDAGIKLNGCQDFRIAHCFFENFGTAGILVNGASWGVIDRCVFKNIYKKAIGNLGYGVTIAGGESWNEEIQPGAKYATFIEDCDFYGCRHAVASNKSARYVFRHNYVAENVVSHSVDAHGPGYGSEIGTQWAEIYNNLIEKNTENREGIMIRGGSAVIYDNIVKDHRQAVVLTLDFDTRLDWKGPYPLPWQLHDTWCWNNTLNGKSAQPFVPKRSENYIREERDYFTRPKPGYRTFPYPHPLTNENNWKGFAEFNPY